MYLWQFHGKFNELFQLYSPVKSCTVSRPPKNVKNQFEIVHKIVTSKTTYLCIYRNRVIYIYLLIAEETRRREVNYRYCLEFALP